MVSIVNQPAWFLPKYQLPSPCLTEDESDLDKPLGHMLMARLTVPIPIFQTKRDTFSSNVFPLYIFLPCASSEEVRDKLSELDGSEIAVSGIISLISMRIKFAGSGSFAISTSMFGVGRCEFVAIAY